MIYIKRISTAVVSNTREQHEKYIVDIYIYVLLIPLVHDDDDDNNNNYYYCVLLSQRLIVLA